MPPGVVVTARRLTPRDLRNGVPVPGPLGRDRFRTLPSPGPRPGVVVVATGDAPAGGGGALADLVRGRAPVETRPCAGPDHDLVSVSGLVPDGVGEAFLTRPDGTAIRADVAGNAYAFLLPPPRGPGPTYVVWTGGDGTPHVQPVGLPFGRGVGVHCPRSLPDLPRVTPGGGSALCAEGVLFFLNHPLRRSVVVTRDRRGRTLRRAIPFPRTFLPPTLPPPAFGIAPPCGPPLVR